MIHQLEQLNGRIAYTLSAYGKSNWLMTRTLSSVTLSEDIILGGMAGADLLAGVRSTISRESRYVMLSFLFVSVDNLSECR